jgi:hypothetical protein
MSRVTINEAGIQSFFRRSPLAGAGIPGLRSGDADRIAARMLVFAQREVGARFNQRTGVLLGSLRQIVRVDLRSGALEVGVGSTAEHAKYLEYGTPAHEIRPSGRKFLVSEANNPTPLRGRRLVVNHPGNQPFFFLRKAVNEAIGRSAALTGVPLR